MSDSELDKNQSAAQAEVIPSAETRETYPPKIEYEWKAFKNLSDEAKSGIMKISERLSPDSEPMDLLIVKGEETEEENIIGLALTSAMFRITNTRKDYPVVRVPIFSGYRELSAVAFYSDLTWDHEDGNQYGLYIFARHKNATNGMYEGFMNMLMEYTNGLLESIGRDQIPPINS